MTPLRVGLGWHINRPVDRDIVWHNGQTGGSHGFIALDKARQTAVVVVVSNSVSSIDDIGFHLLDARGSWLGRRNGRRSPGRRRCWSAV